jgi:hypothetical protein
MVAGVTLRDALMACMHRGKRQGPGSTEYSLRRGLAHLGYDLEEFERVSWSFGGFLPGTIALARLRTRGRRNGYHWIVIDGQTVHDPAIDRPVSWEAYERRMRRNRDYMTSYAVATKRRGLNNGDRIVEVPRL